MLYIVDWVKIRSIHRPQCWRNEVEYLLLQESDGVACSMRRPVERQNPPWDIQNMYGSSFWASHAPFTLTPGSINGFQCCQVSKYRLALCTNLVLLCLTR